MPLGQGFTAEEQITGQAEFGGIQIQVFPMKREVFEKKFPVIRAKPDLDRIICCMCPVRVASPSMGLALGGKIRQSIYEDEFKLKDWDTSIQSRCFVHLVNSREWQRITSEIPPSFPPSAKLYTEAGLPWFDYYSDDKALDGSPVLEKLDSVGDIRKKKYQMLLAGNMSVAPKKVILCAKKNGMRGHK